MDIQDFNSKYSTSFVITPTGVITPTAEECKIMTCDALTGIGKMYINKLGYRPVGYQYKLRTEGRFLLLTLKGKDYVVIPRKDGFDLSVGREIVMTFSIKKARQAIVQLH